MPELYHVLNRGVEKRDIFMDSEDYARFVHDMYEFNQPGRVNNLTYSFRKMNIKDLRGPYIGEALQKKIVDIHGWVLMKNHYHLLLSERVEDGISQFMMKLNVGYAKYFNEKYNRSGTLFQGRTKKILIERDAHFLHILHYIHLNPLDYLPGAKEWRSMCLKDAGGATEYLRKYKWSSYLDYIGEHNFPSILTNKLFKDVFGDYEKTITKYLRDLAADSPIQPLKLE